jgi:hypothetical protein
MRRKIIRSNVNPLRLRELFFAGNSTLTFRNNQSETHMTVRVKQAKDKEDRKKKLPIFFVNVSLLDDKTTGFVFAGTFFTDTMVMKLSKHAPSDSRIGQVMSWIFRAVHNPQILKDKNVSLLHEGRCCRCALPLTHPESINTGLGPDCLKIMLENQKDLNVHDFFEKIEK